MASCLGLRVSTSRPRVTELETTTSTCATEAVRRKHVFEIQGYSSLLGRMGAGEFVQSAAFEVGGFDWAVRYYPRGCSHASPGYASVFVGVVTTADTEASASCELSLLPAASRSRRTPPQVHSTGPCTRHGGLLKGRCSFVKTAKVEEPAYLDRDAIRIQCVVTVFKEPTNSGTHPILPAAAAARVEVPPPELPGDLGRLLYAKESSPAADVTVLVGGEAIAAHRVVLWARCPNLYNRITTWATLTIFDPNVEPAVFKALLHYLYTDSLPVMDDLDAARKAEMLKGLLAAAHLYGLERLKLMCESALSTSLDSGTVVTMLALAEQLRCTALRSACLQFICSMEKRGRSIK